MVAYHELDFSKCEQQWQSHLAIKPGNIVTTPWGRGLGKSWFGRTELYLQVAQWEYRLRPGASHPGVRCVVLMPTLEQAKKVHGDLLCIELEAQWGPLGGKVNRTTWRVTFPGGSWIQFVSAERAHLLRGIRCDVVFVDECDDVPMSIVNSVVIPWFSEPHSLRIQIRSGTPRMGRKGLLYFSHHKLPLVLPGRAFAYHATGYDAPLIVSRDAIEDARLTTPDEIFKREWLCDYDSAEGLVYPAFKEGFHVRKPPEGVVWDDIFVCGDHGFQDPGVLLLCGVLGHGRDAVMWIIAEIYMQHQDPIWWFDQASRWIEWYPRAWWFLDPSRPDMIKGYRGRGARIGETDNDIASGVGCVQQMLKIHSRKGADGGIEEHTRLLVSPECKNTINEFGLYRHKRDSRDPEVMTEDIVDKHNHCFVAGTPVLTDRGTVPIESVTTEDRVLTRNGWEPVKASGMTNPSADTWYLDLSNGVRLEATPDHLVWTADLGFVRLDSLRYGDTLLSCATSMEEASQQYLKARNSVATQTPLTAPCESTGRLKEGDDSTEPSTSDLLVPSPMGTMSTTETATHSTMTSPTSFASAPGTTCTSTCPRRGPSGRASTWTEYDLARRLGTQATKVVLGTPNMANAPMPSESRSAAPVSNAGECTRPRSSVMDRAFAVTAAGHPPGEHPKSTTSIGSAPNADNHSASTSTHGPPAVRVVAASPTGKRVPVYDLTIDGRPEFFAGGVLVHNSMDGVRYGVVGRFFPDRISRRREASAEARQ